jgi:DNA (cytosine-5)-methyltransferase 1
MNNSKIQAISLFSGAGGLDIGSKLCGVDVRVALDVDRDSIETLKLNNQFKKTEILNEDIKNLKPKSIEQYLSNKKTIVIGGPPCQPFSKNGYWVKNENRKSTNDPRNCIEDYFNFVKSLNPDGFLLENVIESVVVIMYFLDILNCWVK